MQLAKVLGSVVTIQKDPSLASLTLLVLQPLDSDRKAVGRQLVAVDSVGAGVGEEVFFVLGKEASFPFLPKRVATDSCVVGIIDHWSVSKIGKSTR